MFSYLRKVFFSAHKDFQELYDKANVWWIIIAYIFSVIYTLPYSLMSQQFNSYDFDTRAMSPILDSQAQLGISAAGIFFALVIMIGAFLLGIVIVLLMVRFSQYLANRAGAELTFTQTLKVYLIALIPNIVLSFFATTIYYLVLGLAFALPAIEQIVIALIGLISFATGMLSFFYTYFLFISGLKQQGNIASDKAIIAGCVPGIVMFFLLIIFVIVFVLCCGAMFVGIFASIAASAPASL